MRVLVVEDEKRVASAVRRGLEAEGFAVDIAAFSSRLGTNLVRPSRFPLGGARLSVRIPAGRDAAQVIIEGRPN